MLLKISGIFLWKRSVKMFEFSLVKYEKNLSFRPLTVGSNVKLAQTLTTKSPSSLGEEIFHDSEAYVGF